MAGTELAYAATNALGAVRYCASVWSYQARHLRYQPTRVLCDVALAWRASCLRAPMRCPVLAWHLKCYRPMHTLDSMQYCDRAITRSTLPYPIPT
eukprot:3006798-Rhodomonas_salina.1